MKTKKVAEMTEKDKVYDKLRQTYGVLRSPAMMELLEFLFPTLEEAEICGYLENIYEEGRPKTLVELAEEMGKDETRIGQILERIGKKIIIKWREREGEPGVLEYYNTGSRGLKNAWGHVGKNDAEGKKFIKTMIICSGVDAFENGLYFRCKNKPLILFVKVVKRLNSKSVP